MPHLLKRPGSRFWIAAYDVPQPDGSTRRMKKSTKCTKRSDALTEALRLEGLDKRGTTATSENSSKAYAILAEAADAAAKGHLSEARARELLARLCEVSTGEPLKFYTVRTWAADWLGVKTVTGKPATIARYKSHVETFLAWLGYKADGKLEAVTKADVRAFRDSIRNGWTEKKSTARAKKTKEVGHQRTAKTSNHYAADVAAMFRSATREGLLLANPCAALESLPEDDSTERQVFSVADVSKLVNAAGEPAWQDPVFIEGRSDTETRASRCLDWQGMILVGFYAGARLGDCARLTWGNVNLSNKSLTFIPAKTSRKRRKLEVPLHPRLVAYLEPLAGDKDKDSPLFPSQFAAPVGGRHGLSSQFIAIMDFGGIDRKTLRAGTKGGQRAQHARSFHALRHSLTSTLANADVSEEIRRRIVGHESADVHKAYTHHERETLARAVAKLPSV
jgi:integrase